MAQDTRLKHLKTGTWNLVEQSDDMPEGFHNITMGPTDLQDHKDGAALRRLREALGRYAETDVNVRWHSLDGAIYRVYVEVEYWNEGEAVLDPFKGTVSEGGWSRSVDGATIAEAADKCREALG